MRLLRGTGSRDRQWRSVGRERLSAWVERLEDRTLLAITATNSPVTVTAPTTGTATATVMIHDDIPLYTLNWSTVDGTAKAGTDYTATSGTALAQTNPSSVPITILASPTFHAPLSFTLNFGDGVVSGSATITINSGVSAPTVTLSHSSPTISENGGTDTLTATLASAVSVATTVNLAYTGTAAASTYTAPATITIPANATTGTGTITAINNPAYNPVTSTTVIATISSVSGDPNETVGTPNSVTTTIQESTTAPTLTLSAMPTTVADTAGTSTITATLSGTQTVDETIPLTFSGTAMEGTDYTVTPTTITVPAGKTTGTATLTAMNPGVFGPTLTATIGDSSDNTVAPVSVMITNSNPMPNVSLSATGTPFNEAGNTATITATLSAKSGEDTTVNLTYGGTAVQGTNYSVSGSTITIPAGQTTGSVTVTGIDNMMYDLGYTVTAMISSATGATPMGTTSVTLQEQNNDPPPTATLQAFGSPISEQGGIATIVATLDAPSTLTTTVNLSYGGSATSKQYTPSGSSITIPPGGTTGSVTITGVDDNSYGPNVTVLAAIQSVTNGEVSSPPPPPASVTITEEDSPPTVTLSQTGNPAAENGGVATVTATLSSASGFPTTVNLAFSGTATSTQYLASANSITIPAGQTTGSITITGVDDNVYGPNVTVISKITSAMNATVNGTQSVTTTITEGDSPPNVSLIAMGNPFMEQGGVASVVANLSAASQLPTTVKLTFGGTAVKDTNYTASSDTITIPAGQLSGSITLTGIDTGIYNTGYTVTATIASATNATPAGTTTVTITETNSDPPPAVTLSISQSTINENGGVAQVIATQSSSSTLTTSINLTFGGSAIQGTNYTTSGATITIPAGQTTGTATITGVDDKTFDANTNVTAAIQSVTNAQYFPPQQVSVQINNVDLPPAVTLSQMGSPIAEMGGTGTVTATLSAASGFPTTVNLGYSGTAIPTTQYTTSGNSITIPAGQTTGNVTITGASDSKFGPNVTVVTTITSATNATVNGTQSVSQTITEGDNQPTVSLATMSSPFSENGGTASIVANLSAVSAQATTVNLTLGGTAVSGTNYNIASTTITIPAGSLSGSVSVTGINDNEFSNGYTVVATIATASGAMPNGVTSVTLKETEASPPPTVTLGLSGSPLAENGGVATITATQNELSLVPTTVTLAYTGTATPTTQYTTSANSITIPAGQMSGTATITGVDDKMFGPNVTVIASIQSVTNGQFAPQQVTATINEVDPEPTVSLSQTGSPIAENGGTGTVTATLSAASTLPTTVNLTFSGTATPTTQYTTSANSITIPPGQTTGSVTLAGVDDNKFGPNVTVVSTISGVTNAIAASPQTVTTTITEGDPAPTVMLSETGSPSTDNGGVITVTATLSTVENLPATINLSFGGNAVSGVNYIPSGNSITIPAGQTSGSITLTGKTTGQFGPPEIVVVSIANATNATPAGGSVSAVFNPSVAAPDFSVNDVTVSQNSPAATFVVSLSAPSMLPATVNYYTQDGPPPNGAVAGIDYASTSGTLTFSPGQTAQTVSVPIIKNPTLRPPTATFTLNLINPTNSGISQGTGTATLLTTGTAPQATISNATILKTTSGTTTVNVNVTLSAPSDVTGTVNFTTVDQSAMAGTDYVATNGVLTFAPGVVFQTIPITIIGSSIPEGTRMFGVTLSNPMNMTLANTQATVTINDPNPPAGIYVTPATVDQGSSTPTTATFNVFLTTPSKNPVSVNYSTQNGTAIAGTDYLATSGVLNFPANSSGPLQITVPILGVTVPAAPKQFTINLANAVNSTISIGQATGTIFDTLSNPNLSINNVQVIVPQTGAPPSAVFTVSLTGQSSLPVTVNYSTSNITAIAGTDYTQTSGTLTFAPGTATQTITVPILSNTALKASSTFAVNLFAPSNATIATNMGTGTIINDNLGQSLTVGDVVTTSSNVDGALTNAMFTINLSTVTPLPVVVNYSTSDGTAKAGTDYVATSGQVIIPAGQTSATVNVPIIGSSKNAPQKQFTFNLSNPQNAAIARGTANGIILSGAAQPLIDVVDLPNAPVDTSSGQAVFSLFLNAPSQQTITVQYQTIDGTAVAGADYVATAGTATFQPGQMTALITVPLLKDPVYKPTSEFSLKVFNATNAGFVMPGDPIITTTLINSSAGPSVSVNDFSQTKTTSGEVNAVATLTLSQPSAVAVVVNYHTQNITAIAGTDYVSEVGAVTFQPGQVTQTVDIPIIGSTIPEGTRTFALDLDTTTVGSIARAQGIGTILDINPPAGISIGNANVTQSGSSQTTATFAVTLATPSALPVTVQYATANGSAQLGIDYLPTSGTLTFPAGTTTENINVTVLGSTVPEPLESFTVNLSNPVNSTIMVGQGTGLILNTVTAPSISITSTVSVTEPQKNPTNAIFNVTLSGPSELPITVNYNTADITAQAGADYTAVSGTLTFAPGQTVQTISVPVLPGTTLGPDKTFAVNLSGATNASINNASGTATIHNSNAISLLSTNDAIVSDGTAGATATFTVTLAQPSLLPVTVQYATADGTAIAGTDYQAASGLLTFAPGQTSQTINVTVLGDTLNQPTKKFTVALSNPQNATLGRATGNGIINNTIAQPAVSVNNVSAVNGTSPNAVFTVSLSGPSGQPITVNYTTIDGTAIAGVDYTTTSGTLTFAPGQTSELVSVPILKDNVFGPPTRTFQLLLSNPSNASLAASAGTATILSNVLPPSVSINNFSQLKTTSGVVNATATLSLSAPSSVPATVFYHTADITAMAGVDYVSETGSVTFQPGQITQTISIPIIGSTVPEGTRSFAVDLDMATGALIATPQGIGTILDINPPAGLLISNATATVSGPAQTTATFTVTLATASAQPISVNYTTINGSAIAGTDYLATSGILTFPAGQTLETIAVPVLGSSLPQPTKTFTVALSSAVNSTIMVGQGTGTIFNTVPAPSLNIASVSVTKPQMNPTNAVFNVTLSSPSTLPVTVNYNTADITAQAGTDYTQASGTLTFAPGQTVQTITVPVLPGTAIGPNVTFAVNLSGASNATLGNMQGVGTIVNNNLAHDITVNDVLTPLPAAGQQTTAMFTVTLSASSTLPITVNYATADASAIAGTDYIATAGTLTFAPGTTQQMVPVTILGSNAVGPQKTFDLNLSAPQNGVITRAQGVGFILNNNPNPLFSVGNVGVTNETPTATFVVSLSGPSTLPITVQYTTVNGTALAGREYTTTSGTLTFAPGQTSELVTVPILKDAVFGPTPETFTLMLSNPTNAGITNATGTGTIVNDTQPPAVTINDFSQLKTTAGTVNATATLSLSAPSELPTTVFYHTADITAVAGVDYVAETGTVTFAPGQLTATISIPIIGSTTPEGTRTFAVDLDMATGGIIARNQGIGTILDVNPPAGVSIQNSSVTVNGPTGTTADFTVTLATASALPVSVTYTTVNGTAVAGTDYTATSGVLTIPAGQTSAMILVPVLGSSVPEPTKTFLVALSNPVNSTIMVSQATGTIFNTVPAPSLSVASVSVVKPQMNPTNAIFNVTLSSPSGQPVTVNYNTSDITAQAGTDYTQVSGTLTFAPGQTVQTITVPILPGMNIGPNVTFAVNLSGATNATVAMAQGTGTIINNNLVHNITVNDVLTPVPAQGATTTALFTVTLSSSSALPITVNYATSNGTAIAGTDYIATAGTLTFAPGTTTQTVSVTVLGTNVSEPEKVFNLNLSSPQNAAVTRAQGQGFLLNTVPAPTVNISSVQVVKPQSGSANAIFNVTLSSVSGQPITVNYNTMDQTAQAGVDYTQESGTLTFQPGQTVQTITVPILPGTAIGPNVTFAVNLSGPSNATIGNGQGVGTIINNNLVHNITVGDVFTPAPAKGNTAQAVFTVSLTSPSTLPITVNYATADASAIAGTDYVATSGTLTFAPGTTSQTVSVTILGTNLAGPQKQFALNLTNAQNATILRAQANGFIVNNNPSPLFSVSNVSVTNETPNAIFTVSLSSPSSLPISVSYNTADGTAQAGREYTSTNGTLTFAPGQTSMLVSVPILKDAVFGPTPETFTLNLANPTNATILNGSGTGTIVNDTLPPQVTIADFSQLKTTSGTVNATATLTLSAPSELPATVYYHTANITAIAGVDYTQEIGSVTFQPGQLTQTIQIPIIGSTVPEGTRTFAVDLDMASGAIIARNQAIGTILDVNPPVGLSIQNTTVIVSGPSGNTAHFTVTLATASALPVSVSYTTVNGTALAGTDYLATSGILTFPAGQTTESIDVPVLGSSVPEAIKTFSVALSNSVNSTILVGQGTATIINTVAAPGLSINSVSVIQPQAGTANAVFNVTLSGPSTLPITVNFNTADQTALAGLNYTQESGTLTFQPGQTVQTITVPILPSTALGPNLTFAVNLSGASNADVITAQGIGTIINNNLVHDLVVGDATVVAPRAGGTATAMFTVTLSSISALPVTVDYSTADGTAVAGTDYLAAVGQLLFNPGETTQTVSVTILGQALSGPQKNFTLNLTTPQNAVITRAQGMGIILNDVAAPLISVADINVTSASPMATFTVVLSSPSSQTVMVQYSTADGTAVAGTDYTAKSGTLVFAPGITSQVVNIPLINPMIYGPSKTFTLNLSNPSNASFIDNSATATITDATPQPQITINNFSQVEPTSGSTLATATLTLSAPSELPVSVNFSTADLSAIAGVDYTATSGIVTFAPGQVTQTISIPINGGTTPGPNKQFAVNLVSATGGTIAKAQAIGTIINNNPPVGVSVGDTTAVHGLSNTVATFTVMLAAPSQQVVTVQYNTADLTATAGIDYLAAQGTLTFAPGQTQQTVTVTVLGSNIPQPTKQFALVLSNPVNTTISTPQATATITNTVAGPNISITNAQVVKPHTGTTPMTFTVTLSQPSAQIVTVSYATADGTAIADTNYVPTTGTLTFAPGTTTQTITVPVIGNATPGPSKTFMVMLNGASNALIANPTATGTIVDQDTMPNISIDNVSVMTAPLGPLSAVFTVTLDQVGTVPVTLNYATADGTALAGVDYTAVQGMLTFAPGETVQTITVPIATSTMQEMTKTFFVNLSGATNGTILHGQGIGTIISGIPAPSISITNATVTAPASGSTNAVFEVSLSSASGLPVTVTYATMDDTAVAGVNYTAEAGTLTFQPGQTIQQIVVPVLAESLNDMTRTFFVNLSNPLNATIAIGHAVGTILNGVAEPVIAVNNAPAVTNPEIGTALSVFTVTLSAPSLQPVSVQYATADGTALAGIDYTAVSGTLTFQPGQTQLSVDVPVIPNTGLFNGHTTKQFLLLLSNPTNATLGDLQGIGTIIETTTAPAFSINDITVQAEPLAIVDAVFTVSLSEPSAVVSMVSYMTADVNSTAGVDYVPQAGVLTFQPGQTTAHITIPVFDNLIRSGESFAVFIFNPVNATISKNEGIATVANNNGLVVTNTNDAGPGSLRQAMILANIIPGPNTITFDIPGPAPHTINVRSPLPLITDPVTIDGTSEPGYNGAPLVEINGAGAGPGADGFVIVAGNSTIEGLAINRFSATGIEIVNLGGDTIVADYIGTAINGMFGEGNGLYGIEIADAPDNQIGGTFTERNVISGNLLGGIHVAGTGAFGNQIIGNLIGTNAAGMTAIPNGQNGVYIDNAPSNTVIGRNVISGNGTNGVKIYGLGSMKNRVQGNIIGGPAVGSGFLGNQGFGIIINNVSANAKNVINPNTVTTNALGRFFKGHIFGKPKKI